jgi:cellulose synthase/poly-beta-1,6-N-acetylglucosamine synthase-like glycosyltransferase
MHHSPFTSDRVSAIIPARNEEAVIAECVRSLAGQPQIIEILVVNDHSSDRTAEVVGGMMKEFSQVRLLEAPELPPGWVGKNNAVWAGAQAAAGDWFLFTDADAEHWPASAAKALRLAEKTGAVLVSYSAEQVMENWYERAAIPYIYSRLGKRFRFEEVNDTKSTVAAANGQFILIRRDVYEAVGGHVRIAGEVLEDVALAKNVKKAGYRMWFGSGRGTVRVRMYRSFEALWRGWQKNLYPLMGGSLEAVIGEIAKAILPLCAVAFLALAVWQATFSARYTTIAALFGILVLWQVDGRALRRAGFSSSLAAFSMLGRLLYSGILWSSFQSYQRGRLAWKGRAYPADTPGASKG